jgi:lipoprotein LprG
MNRRRRVAGAVVMGALIGPLAAGCGGSGTKTVAASTLLSSARQTINAASAAHFVVTSTNLPDVGTVLTSGTGDLVRPGELRGNFGVAVNGLPLSLAIIETGGKFYAKLPLATSYKITDPHSFGFGDPAKLIDPNNGISRILTQISSPKVSGQTRVNGEVLETITGTVPGSDVTDFLPDAAPQQPVNLVLAINTATSQVRQVKVTGPFAVATTQSTYTLVLTNYNEAVTITAPPT